MKKIINSISGLFSKYREIILYIIFGVLSTIINIIVYYLLTNYGEMNYLLSNFFAWIISVAFAFVTNKSLVFKSKNNFKQGLKEALYFLGARIFSLGIDMLIIYLLISVLSWDSLISKIISNIVVIILNYILSKLYIFKKR